MLVIPYPGIVPSIIYLPYFLVQPLVYYYCSMLYMPHLPVMILLNWIYCLHYKGMMLFSLQNVVSHSTMVGLPRITDPTIIHLHPRWGMSQSDMHLAWKWIEAVLLCCSTLTSVACRLVMVYVARPLPWMTLYILIQTCTLHSLL